MAGFEVATEVILRMLAIIQYLSPHPADVVPSCEI